MRRFADLFIAICIPIVATSAGAVAYWQFGSDLSRATAVAGAVLIGAIGVQWIVMHGRDRRSGGDRRIDLLTRRIGEIAADVAALERRVGAPEEVPSRGRRDELDQVVAEIEVIGTLTRQVIEAVADLEVQLAETRGALLRGGDTGRGEPRPATEKTSAKPDSRPSARSALVPERFAHLDEDGFLALVRRAIDGDRIDVHLQPIVSLPQRKIRFYEALVRLRTEDGATIHPSDFIPIAENRGYMAAIDEQILLKSVAILRRLAERSREIGVFLNLSAASLGHPGFFRDFLSFMEKNRDLADMLVLEFPQASVRAMGPIEQEGMRALKELGFRFSVDQMTDLKISFQNLADRGFRWAKISVDRLLHRTDELGTDIHPVDLTDYFRRFGMELIADHVERETEVVDVLDYGVRLGQGNLFAPPRPVRIDAAALDRPAGALARAIVASPKKAEASSVSAEGGRANETRASAEPPTGSGRAAPAAKPQPPAAAPSATGRKPAGRAAGEEPPAVRPGIRIVPGTTH